MADDLTIPASVRGGQWLWPNVCDGDVRRRAALALAQEKAHSNNAFAALGDCLPIAHEPEQDVRLACAEGLLKLDRQKAIPALWAAHKAARTESREPYLQWEGLLVGILLVHGVLFRNKSLVQSAEHFLYEERATRIRSSTFEYLLRHPNPELEKYAAMGLRWDLMTRDVTAFFLRQWPYSRTIVTAMVEAYDRSNAKEFLITAFGRMKANDGDVLNLMHRDIGLVRGKSATSDVMLQEKIAEVLVFDLKNCAGLNIVTSVIESGDINPTKRVLYARRLGLQKTEWALKALLDLANKLVNGVVRYEVALALHRNFSTAPNVLKAIRPIFEAALKDPTASPYIHNECRARLETLNR